MSLVMLNDNLLIEPLDSETTTSSGIVIPDSAKEKPQKGKVIGVGPGKMVDGARVKLEVSEGDVVMYRKWGGTEIKVDNKDLLIVKEDDILAIVK